MREVSSGWTAYPLAHIILPVFSQSFLRLPIKNIKNKGFYEICLVDYINREVKLINVGWINSWEEDCDLNSDEERSHSKSDESKVITSFLMDCVLTLSLMMLLTLAFKQAIF